MLEPKTYTACMTKNLTLFTPGTCDKNQTVLFIKERKKTGRKETERKKRFSMIKLTPDDILLYP